MLEEGDSPGRIFVVGFPRSGTTLLQALLASHPRVLSLPETFFFDRLVPVPQWTRALKRPSQPKRARLDTLAARDRRLAPWKGRAAIPDPLAGLLTQRFVAALDEELERGALDAWLEKTPSHLHRIPLITRHVPDARFVHIVREGLPAVSSLFTVSHEHPLQWGERTHVQCADRWCEDIRISASYANHPAHSFISYEQLVGDPGRNIALLLGRLGLRSDPETLAAMLEEYGVRSAEVVTREPWKQGVTGVIANQNRARSAALDPKQKREVTDRIEGCEAGAERLPFLVGDA
jgi:hypothetical protein